MPPVPAPPARYGEKSALKRDFIRQAQDTTYVFEKKITLASDVSDAVRWISERTPGAVRRAREEAVWRIETRARQLEQSGAIEAWYRGADEGVRGVAWYVNGPLLEELAASIGHIDRECVEFFRQACPRAAVACQCASVAREGAPLLGDLPVSGIGAPATFPQAKSAEDLLKGARAANRRLLARLRLDPNAQELWDLTDKDFRLWRMRAPEDLSDIDLDSIILVPRFGVEQGVRSDGTRKARARARTKRRSSLLGARAARQVRAVDDCAIADINAATRPRERMRHETIDHLFLLCRLFTATVAAASRGRKGHARLGCRHQKCRACLS